MAALCAVLSMPACADDALLDGARATVRQYLETLAGQAGLNHPAIEVAVLPPRRTPDACPGRYRFDLLDSRRIARMTVNARCADTPGERIVLVARATVAAQVPVVARDIPAGRPIGASDVVEQERAIPSLTDIVLRAEDVVGRSSTRTLRLGQFFPRKSLRSVELIHKGDPVRLIQQAGALTVTDAAVALDGGALGDTVRVRNSRSNQTVTAHITGPGTVEPDGAAPQPPSR